MLWSNKRYYAFNFFLRQTFGEKLMKLPLDAGFTCPNRDGRKGFGGCVFCGARGSGDFAAAGQSIPEQIEAGKALLLEKWPNGRYIAYFQAFTNTYAPLDVLESVYRQATEREDIAAVAVATRPDCVDKSVAALIQRLSEEYQKPFFAELGLQTSNPATARLINRQYDNRDFETAVRDLKDAGIHTVCHLILGLPHETKADMLESVRYAAAAGVDGVKLQLMHILKETALAAVYETGAFAALSVEDYIDLVVSCLEILPENIVIHRLTGDGPREKLIAPLWSTDKKKVLNAIDAALKKRETWQGKYSN